MKKLIAITLCAVMALSFAACSNTSPSKDNPQKQTSGDQIPNPWVDCNAMTDAEKISGFNVTLPKKMPEGYEQKLIQAVEKKMVQVFYENGEKEILIRKAKGSEDISGDYNKYNENNTVTVDGLEISTKGNDGKINVATWSDGEYTYAITNDTGLETATINDMVAGIR